MVLETQDEILLANLPPIWQLVCDNEIDRPIPLESAIYAVVKRDDLCTCGILAQHIFLYESMHTCEKPDTSIQLYYTYVVRRRGRLAPRQPLSVCTLLPAYEENRHLRPLGNLGHRLRRPRWID